MVAGTRSSDEAALQPTRQNAEQGIERKVDDLLGQMTLDEKLQQVQLLSDGQITDADAQAGVGGVFSLTDPAKINHFQHIAVEQSRLHIPILFAYDTIHGYRTIFPIPLGAASSFDPSVATADDTIAARETATVGIKQIYSPMVDVSHEPRWGRISEGAGEDPYLGSVFAAARVKAAQGSDYSAPDKVVTSVKHFAAYGQPEGGREYNTTDMSEARLRNLYLPPFKAAIDAGADTVMCSFNAINGVPGCAEPRARDGHPQERVGLRRLHRERLHRRRRAARLPAEEAGHRPLRPRRRGRRAGRGGGSAERRHRLRDGQHEHPRLRRAAARAAPHLDGAARRRRAPDPAREVPRGAVRPPVRRPGQGRSTRRASSRRPTAPRRARRPAKSMVLLKNDDATLPLDPAKSVAVIGPLGDDQHDMLGPWWGQGSDADAVSVYAGIKAQDPNTTFAQGCTIDDKDPPDNTPADECGSDAGFAAAVAAAKRPTRSCSRSARAAGRAARPPSRSEIDLPGKQQELIDAIKATGKPFVVVLFNGRPLTLTDVAAASPGDPRGLVPRRRGRQRGGRRAVRQGQPGRQAARCRSRASLGQMPIYYNHEPTGRPCDVTSKYNSRYRDLDVVRSAVRVRLRPQLHDVRGHEPAPQLAERVEERQGHGDGRRHQHRRPCRATTSCSSTSTTRSRASRSRCAACAGSSA